MTRTRTLALLVAALVLLIGLSAVSVGGDTDSEIHIEQPGTPTDLVSGDRNHTITDLYINTSGTTLSENKFRLSIDLTPISDAGVNTSNADIKNVSVENGTVDRIKKHESADGNASIQLVVEKTESSDSVHIKQIGISNLSTNNTGPHSNVQYRLHTTEDHRTTSEDVFINESETTPSEPFDIVGGSFQFREQGTVSTTPSGFTLPSVTVEDVQANVDSTLVATFKNDGDQIAGITSVSSETADGDNEIALQLSNTGGTLGSHTVHLIPDSQFDSEYEAGDQLSNETTASRIASETNRSFRGVIEFGDLESESPIEDSITVSDSNLRHEDDVPYILTLHPIDDHEIVQTDRFLGSSTVVSGDVSDLKIELNDQHGESIRLSRSNQYAAVLRVVDDGYEVGEEVPIGSAPTLPNSDARQGFAQNGVSDFGRIKINRSSFDLGSADRVFETGVDYSDEIVYAGERVAFNNTVDDSAEIQLYQQTEEDSGILKYTELTESGHNPLFFNTSDFETGEYFLTGGDYDKNDSFTVVSSEDQYIELTQVPNSTYLGNEFEFNTEADANTTHLTLTGPNGTDVVTAMLSTPRGESVDIALNTYLAGDPDAETLLTVAEPASVDSLTTPDRDGPLPTGNYTLTARAAPDGPTATATTTLAPRSTDDLTVYTAADTPPDAFTTPADVTDAIATGTLSPTDTVRANDTVVYAATATGLDGFLATADPAPETGAALADLDGLTFTVTDADASTTEDANPAIRATANETLPLLGGADDRFLVANATEMLGGSASEHATETDLVAAFEVADDRLRAAADADPDADDGHTAATELTYVPQTDDEPDEPTESDGSTESDGATDSDGSTESDGSSDATDGAGSDPAGDTTAGGSTADESDSTVTGGGTGDDGTGDDGTGGGGTTAPVDDDADAPGAGVDADAPGAGTDPAGGDDPSDSADVDTPADDPLDDPEGAAGGDAVDRVAPGPSGVVVAPDGRSPGVAASGSTAAETPGGGARTNPTGGGSTVADRHTDTRSGTAEPAGSGVAASPLARTGPDEGLGGGSDAEHDPSAIETVSDGPPTIEDAPLRSTADDLSTAAARAVGVGVAALVLTVGTVLRRRR